MENEFNRQQFNDILHSFHKECENPECNKHDSPFASIDSCRSHHQSPGDENLESTSAEQCGCHHRHAWKSAIIFDRRYEYSDREICSRNFSLRLGGLGNRMASKLRKYLGCKIEIGIQCESMVEKVSGKITHVGADFVEIHTDKDSDSELNKSKGKKKHKQKGYTMIPFDTINWMDFDNDTSFEA
ncbi:hypothetical protein M3204_11180 [Mesobacillus subterraneus]|uniref:hypothetical protein n=1 Tax=Mesobacillus subterraneus TaxID=285983 RepID=UPI00203CE63C|nr:hypothetical protein [Mesobacillus subterraneus]MCM3664971.1 hypothetical protein [Mesobacillus subterraneus]MCM3682058.1 hypothetical protein [Mesobacillus subterraneus]